MKADPLFASGASDIDMETVDKDWEGKDEKRNKK